MGSTLDPYLFEGVVQLKTRILESTVYSEHMFTIFAIGVLLQNTPDLEKIAAAGRASKEQMAQRQTIWTATHKLENGASIEVHVVRQGDRQSVALRVANQD